MRGLGAASVLVLGVLWLMPMPAAAELVAAKHVQVELVADVTSVAPGATATLGLHFVPEREWHIYWRNPGDSGEAPRVDWTAPDAAHIGALDWPAPQRLAVGTLVNFGYPGEAVLTAPLTVAADAGGAAPLAIGAGVHWLVCDREECVPGSAKLSLALPVAAGGAPSEAAELIDAARARLPAPAPAGWRLAAAGMDDAVRLQLVSTALGPGVRPFFFSDDRQSFEPGQQTWSRAGDGGGTITLGRRNATELPARLAGVLDVGGRAYTIDVPISAAVDASRAAPATTTQFGIAPAGAATDASADAVPASLTARATPLALAFAGGLLLNLMPCVFPVLALKALALTGLAGEARRRIRRHGLIYTAGIVVSFWALAALLLAARAGGAELGWGFQLQSPTMIAALAGLFFWMALVLLDVSPVGGSIMGVGQHLTSGDGDRAAFFTGVLATVVATPCTAPFMGTAIGYALGQSAATALAVFTCLGLGLALPYVVITLVPALATRLPRPGAWMETLKQLLAFPLLLTVVWLVWVASVQAGPPAVAAILLGLVLLGFAAWSAARWRGPLGLALTFAALAAAVVAAVGIAPLGPAASTTAAPVGTAANDRLQWEPFSMARVAELRNAGRPVFVDFTAAWCVTCQVNKKVALETAEVEAKMRELGVVAVRADWTRPDAEITRALQEFGRDGVPLYVLYSGRRDDPPRVLPQILTPTIVITELEQLERRSST